MTSIFFIVCLIINQTSTEERHEIYMINLSAGIVDTSCMSCVSVIGGEDKGRYHLVSSYDQR